jgi:pyruvate dehydrogenase E1 component beta subunit
MEHKDLWGLAGEVDEAADPVPLGVARRVREGDDVTVVAWSGMVHKATAAADLLRGGPALDVLDLRTIYPWDREAVFRSVRRTGRLLVVHEAVEVAGFGAEVAATVAEHLFDALKGPVRRLGAPRVPIPYAPPLEALCRVTPERIAAVAREMAWVRM